MGVLGSIFGFGDQIKRNVRDFASNPRDYIEGAVHQNNIEWKKDPIERSLGFFNPVPLGTMGNFVLNKKLQEAATNLSRRDFMKKSAGLAAGSAVGAGATAKLLRKFAPEERAIVKEAVVEAAPKYKYNSLKEYWDDINSEVNSSVGPRGWQTTEGGFGTYDDLVKQRLLQDEELYKNSKFFYKDDLWDKKAGGYIDPFSGKLHDEEFLKNIPNTKDWFSPQAKAEMKEYKNFVNQYRPSESGHAWARPDDIQEWIAGNRIPF